MFFKKIDWMFKVDRTHLVPNTGPAWPDPALIRSQLHWHWVSHHWQSATNTPTMIAYKTLTTLKKILHVCYIKWLTLWPHHWIQKYMKIHYCPVKIFCMANIWWNSTVPDTALHTAHAAAQLCHTMETIAMMTTAQWWWWSTQQTVSCPPLSWSHTVT